MAGTQLVTPVAPTKTPAKKAPAKKAAPAKTAAAPKTPKFVKTEGLTTSELGRLEKAYQDTAQMSYYSNKNGTLNFSSTDKLKKAQYFSDVSSYYTTDGTRRYYIPVGPVRTGYRADSGTLLTEAQFKGLVKTDYLGFSFGGYAVRMTEHDLHIGCRKKTWKEWENVQSTVTFLENQSETRLRAILFAFLANRKVFLEKFK